MRRPDPFSQNSVFDEIISVLDKHRAREADAQHAEQMDELERERAAESAMQHALISQAGEALHKFVTLEERRVVALERIASSCSTLVEKLQRVTTISQ